MADPPPFTIFEGGAPASTSYPLLLVCDHASAAVPASLGRLGLDDASLRRHIAWDIGAADLTRALACRLGATAILSGYSRLVIDCNRRLDDPTVAPQISDGTAVPGNRGLGEGEIGARARSYYWPYHDAIAAALDRFQGAGVAPAVLSIHSFTPQWDGKQRPWPVGVLWDRDGRIALPLLRRLRHVHGIEVGDNEPYSAREPPGFTMMHHAESRGLPHGLLEVRQDEIADARGVAAMGDLIAAALRPILDDPGLYRAGFTDAQGSPPRLSREIL